MEALKGRLHRLHQSSRAKVGSVRAHPAGLPVVGFVGLLTLSALVLLVARHNGVVADYVSRDHFIAIVSYDGERYTVPTKAQTVGELLDSIDIKINPGDRVEPAQDAPVVQDNFLVNVYRSAPVVIYDGGMSMVTKNAGATPRSIVAQSGVKLHSEDKVTAQPTENFVLEQTLGSRVIVQRATPLSLTLYGTKVDVYTQKRTVSDLLKEKDVKLSKDDTVKPALDTVVTPNMQIAVVRNGVQVVTVEEVVPTPVQTVLDTSLSFGSEAIRQAGSPGKIVKTYQLKIENGEEVSRVLLQAVTAVEPVKRIIAKGSTVNIPPDKQAVMAAAGISPADYAYVDYVFSRESRWNAAAVNPGGCTGLGQACPGSKLAAACPNWQNDAVCQTRFFTSYAVGRYGSWGGAYNTWLGKGWW